MSNTISETNILRQNNRTSSTDKEIETIITKNYDTTHSTQSSILHQNQRIKSDREKIIVWRKTILQHSKNRRIEKCQYNNLAVRSSYGIQRK